MNAYTESEFHEPKGSGRWIVPICNKSGFQPVRLVRLLTQRRTYSKNALHLVQ